MSQRLYQMTFPSVYKALVAKVERKGFAGEQVAEVTAWLTGYPLEMLLDYEQVNMTYGEFFEQAPAYHVDRLHITGKICGVQIETLEDPLMQEIRRLDKLVDWLAKGKTVAQVVEKYSN